jgi:F-box protein 11
MNTNSELDRIVSDWLEDRVVDPPHGSLQSALARAHQTPQQRSRWLLWQGSASSDRRERIMISVTAVAASVAAVVLTAALVIPRESTDVAPPALPGSTYSVAVEGGDFRTIGEAVAAAQDGDTVLVEPGTYDEALVIEKDITIEGTGAAPRQTVIAVPPGARETLEDVLPLHESVAGLEAPARPSVGLQLLDSEAVLRNLQIMGQDDGVAVIVRGGAPAFEDVVVRHAGERDANRVLAGSLFIDGASAPTISGGQMWHRVQIDDDSTVTFVEALLQYGKVVVQGGSSLVFTRGTVFASDIQPITIVDGASATIAGTEFQRGGVDVVGGERSGTSAAITGSSFANASGYAVRVTGGASATITESAFSGNQNAVAIEGSHAAVRGNEFLDNYTSLSLSDSSSELSGNRVQGGVIGVEIEGSGEPLVVGNSLQDVRSRGIVIGGGTSPVIEGNSVCGSVVNLVVDAGAQPTIGDNDICPDGTTAG